MNQQELEMRVYVAAFEAQSKTLQSFATMSAENAVVSFRAFFNLYALTEPQAQAYDILPIPPVKATSDDDLF